MPVKTFARLGGAAVVAAILGATAAQAVSPDVVITQHARDARSVAVTVSDLNLSTPADRDLLAIRVNNAARYVCDVHDSSRLDRLPSAQSCMADARSGALAQLGVRGATASAVLTSATALD